MLPMSVATLGRRVASSYLLRRVLKALLTVFVMASFTFFLVRLIPGGPVEAYIANLVTQYNATRDEAERQAASLFSIDLESPIYQQYFELDLSKLNADGSWSLPVPATYIVRPNGEIYSRLVEMNFLKRMEPADILTVLRHMQ